MILGLGVRSSGRKVCDLGRGMCRVCCVCGSEVYAVWGFRGVVIRDAQLRVTAFGLR